MADTTATLRITGMTCERCAETVRAALEALPGVRASVSLRDGTARILAAGSTGLGDLVGAVEARGFGARAEHEPDPGLPTRHARDLHLVVLGSGSAAFAAALRAAEEGARVTMVESGTLGGTCVNVGCVPSKILVRAAHAAHVQAHHPFAGIERHRPAVDRPALLAQQQARVEALRRAKYEDLLADTPGIALVRGRARLDGPRTVIVDESGGATRRLVADRVLIATGSGPAVPEIPGLAESPYWTSTEALAAETLPEHLIVIGASVVAVELAQAFRRLGSRVTVLARSTVLSRFDPDLGAGLAAALAGEGVEIATGTVPESVSFREGRFRLRTAGGDLEGDRLLVAAGRRANTAGLGLERAGVATDEDGAIVVDERMRTSAEGIYAAGDCTDRPRYVYVAAAGGTRAARNVAGEDARLDLGVLPEVVFTDPQVATVGLTEGEARARGLDAEARTLPLAQVPRALVAFDIRGFVRLVAERASGRLLGAQVLAAEAGEVIQAAALALRAGMTVGDLADQLFPYLTMVEGLKLCAQTFTRDVTRLSCCAG